MHYGYGHGSWVNTVRHFRWVFGLDDGVGVIGGPIVADTVTVQCQTVWDNSLSVSVVDRDY